MPAARIHTKKVSSSVDDYARAIVEGLDEVFRETGLAGRDFAEVLHGTTVASNAILEFKGARTGLITTKGFRDVLEIRRIRMPKLYDLAWEKPVTLVERYLRLEVDERLDAHGRVEKALDPAEVERVLDRLLAEKIDALAVCLLQLLREPRARAAHRRDRPAESAGSHAVGECGGAARDPRVRAHVDDRHQRLRDADRAALPAHAAQRARHDRREGAPDDHAVERRAHDRRGRRRAARAHHRVGARGRRRRRAGARAQDRSRPSS